MLISTGGTVIKVPVEDVKRLGRSTQGVIVMRLREGEHELVSTLAPVVDSTDDDDGRIDGAETGALDATRSDPMEGELAVAEDEQDDDEESAESHEEASE
jgi:DNA gyrase subunit A